MIAVILNHLYGPIIYGRLTYPFELVGFFFVAGYTFNLKENLWGFLRGKIKTLLVPIVIFGLINAVLSYIIKGGPFFLRVAGVFMQRPGEWDDLWFVACLFTMELIFYLVIRFTSSLFGQLIICLALSVFGYVQMTVLPIALPWHIENACILIMFLYFGYVMRKSMLGSKVMTYCEVNSVWKMFLLVLCIYLIFVLIIKNYPIDIHLHEYGQFIVFMIGAWLGLGVVFGLSLCLEKWHEKKSLRFLAFIGANTFVYYAFQSKAISVLTVFGDRIGFYSWTYIGCIVYCISVCLVLMIPSYIIKRYAPFMLGRF